MTGRRPSVALIQWRGDIGGAEVLTGAIAASLRQLGVEASIVFVGSAEPLASRLEALGVPYRQLGFERGREVLAHPRRFAAAVRAAGGDGAILPECGFVGPALRAGGYRGPIVGVEHGPLLLERSMPLLQRAPRLAWRLAAALADDVDVGVSDFMVTRLRRVPHARLTRIYNGIDPDRYGSVQRPGVDARDLPPGQAPERDREIVVGFAGRLIAGKGADDAIEAVARARAGASLRLTIAGDGPERARLDAVARRVGAGGQVEFCGLVSDMPAFWERCDVAVVPSNGFIESFGMVALEAMASARPVVATRNGALPELVLDGVTGTLVPPGDTAALAEALIRYAQRSELRSAHGAAGRARAIERFAIRDCAISYLTALGLR